MNKLTEDFRMEKRRVLKDPDSVFIPTGEMAKTCGITYRQLDSLAKNGIVEPDEGTVGKGDPRMWAKWQVGQIVEAVEKRKPHGY